MLFLWTATAFDSVPVTAVSLSGRDWNTCQNHCLPPSKGQLLLLNHRPHRVRTPRLQFAPSGKLLDRSSSFRQSIQILGAMVGVRRAEAYRNKVCHTGLWTLSRRHIQPKVWKCPLHIRGRSKRAIFHLSWSRCMCIQDICLAAGGLRRIPSPGFTSWTFSP